MGEKSWKEIILPEYEIRKTKAQKTRFIEMLSEKYGERMHVEESGGFTKSRNIVIGNPERAKVVYTAHYDTCPVMPFPNFITPKNIPIYILYQLLIVLIIYLPVIAVVALSMHLTNGMSEDMQIIVNEAVFFASMFGILYLLTNGPANRHTANDNTSGVVTVLTLADRITSDDVAFILFDNEEKGLRGSSAYAQAHKNVRNNTLIVNLDCVSDGDYIMFLVSKKAKNTRIAEYICTNAENRLSALGKEAVITGPMGTVYPSDQNNFKISIAVSALKKSKIPLIGLYMDKIHTKHDTNFDGRNIDALCELFTSAAEYIA